MEIRPPFTRWISRYSMSFDAVADLMTGAPWRHTNPFLRFCSPWHKKQSNKQRFLSQGVKVPCVTIQVERYNRFTAGNLFQSPNIAAQKRLFWSNVNLSSWHFSLFSFCLVYTLRYTMVSCLAGCCLNQQADISMLHVKIGITFIRREFAHDSVLHSKTTIKISFYFLTICA